MNTGTHMSQPHPHSNTMSSPNTSSGKPALHNQGSTASLDALIFDEQKSAAATHADELKDDEPDAEEKKPRTSLSNVFPVDKLKNGASNAGKFFGSTLTSLKENSAKGWENAKQTKAGGALASGLTTASVAASTTASRIKDTDAYKKTTTAAAQTFEKAKQGAEIGVEKVKQGATFAKDGAVQGIEKVRARVGKPGDEADK
ncbi:hypothetical protein DYB30_001401 [Aphanomyces astaci]|uniref:Uncharacterized protein n=1 Tax=Aphanomyces astaci TaxID=112090 RepID=A0A397CBM6_APHAT|nr:hypothetical protein DYB36_012692 [Aphanomyces astaci]RHY41654.1 hypothetical protein DYB30_001401 [Aphanomyces astaci]RHY67069.1 hypothetical protein DYB34_003161 [Aphanomyces astaci]RHZ07881.1 hypothetical protein DYB31_006477 [Aphanomyces astaci]RHZ30623.1 hypothetical protein DYB26_001366 [Aphanomyces astaci]